MSLSDLTTSEECRNLAYEETKVKAPIKFTATFTKPPEKEIVDAINKMVELAYKNVK